MYGREPVISEKGEGRGLLTSSMAGRLDAGVGSVAQLCMKKEKGPSLTLREAFFLLDCEKVR